MSHKTKSESTSGSSGVSQAAVQGSARALAKRPRKEDEEKEDDDFLRDGDRFICKKCHPEGAVDIANAK